MRPTEPSRTARAAAAHRAVHQVVEGGRIFADPLALAILGRSAEDLVGEARADPGRRAMGFFIAARTRFAEDRLATAVARGTGQLVVLGAGLDTFAYRNPFGERLRVFEVDHPATQAWKRARLDEIGIPAAATPTFAPVDFERQALSPALVASGFDPSRRAFFTWLGVVPYLTQEAVFATLGYVASLPGGAEIVFDYGDPPAARSPDARAVHEARAARVAGAGEAWITFFDPGVLAGRLRQVGLPDIEDLGPRDLVAAYLPGRGAPVPIEVAT